MDWNCGKISINKNFIICGQKLQLCYGVWPEEEDEKGEAVLGGGDAGETQAGQ